MNDRYVIGVDFGGTRTKVGLVDASYKVRALMIMPTAHHEAELLDGLQNCINTMLQEQGIQKRMITGIGVSIGSFVFGRNRIDTMCDFIDLPDSYPLADVLQEKLQLPCQVENDAKLIAIAESRYGAGRGSERVITLTLGTGVGFGFTAHGRVENTPAYQHLAGHICVRAKGEEPVLDAVPCYCVVEGCMESTCSGTALARLAEEITPGLTVKALFALAKDGDGTARNVVERYNRYLMRALNQYTLLFTPDCIVLGGGVAHGLEPYLPKLNEMLTARVYRGHHPIIKVAALHESGGVIGAATLFENGEDI